MTLWQLKTFATVAREGSFTKAGKVLQISQPSVSSLVISLQKELGVKLFEKLGMKPRLTEAGRLLLKRAESVLGITEKIPEEMEEIKGLKKGRLAVGGSGFAGSTFLPAAVHAFKKTVPSIEVTVMIQRSRVIEERLLKGELDVALIARAPESRLIVAEQFREDEIVVIAPHNHPLTRRRSVPLRCLVKESIIAQDRSSNFRQKVEELFAMKGLPFTPELEIDIGSGSRDALRSAVANGLGIAFVSKCHINPHLESGRLKILKVPEVNLKRVMYLVFHRGRKNSLAQLFVDFLRKYQEL